MAPHDITLGGGTGSVGHCRARGTRLGCGRSWQVQWRSTGTADIAGVGVETIGAVAFRGALGAVLALAPEGEHTVGAGITQVFARVVHRTPVGAGVEGLLEQVAAAGEPEVVLGAASRTHHTTYNDEQVANSTRPGVTRGSTMPKGAGTTPTYSSRRYTGAPLTSNPGMMLYVPARYVLDVAVTFSTGHGPALMSLTRSRTSCRVWHADATALATSLVAYVAHEAQLLLLWLHERGKRRVSTQWTACTRSWGHGEVLTRGAW